MIIRGGENVYPAEIEQFLYQHPKIQEVEVFILYKIQHFTQGNLFFTIVYNVYTLSAVRPAGVVFSHNVEFFLFNPLVDVSVIFKFYKYL